VRSAATRSALVATEHDGSSHFTSNPYDRHSIDLCFLYDNRAQEGLFKARVDIPPRETHLREKRGALCETRQKCALLTSQRVLREQNCGGQGAHREQRLGSEPRVAMVQQ